MRQRVPGGGGRGSRQVGCRCDSRKRARTRRAQNQEQRMKPPARQIWQARTRSAQSPAVRSDRRMRLSVGLLAFATCRRCGGCRCGSRVACRCARQRGRGRRIVSVQGWGAGRWREHDGGFFLLGTGGAGESNQGQGDQRFFHGVSFFDKRHRRAPKVVTIGIALLVDKRDFMIRRVRKS